MTMTSALSMRGLFAARKIEPPIRTIHVRALKAVMYSWARKSRALSVGDGQADVQEQRLEVASQPEGADNAKRHSEGSPA